MELLKSAKHFLQKLYRGRNSKIIYTGEGYDPTWWKEGILYQIYPQSFFDSDGDGYGDIAGVVEKLDYIKSLGVTIVWMTPFYKSPLVDNGYDISDYRSILPRFGTMKQFDGMVKGMHKRGIKFVMDLVANHTSNQHQWFLDACTSRDNIFYDYYHWWPAENGSPPHRHSLFDPEGAWNYVESVHAYYYATFTKFQPDLNWENPKVRQEIFDIMKFWIKRGVDGFRLDAFQFISKDITWPEFPDGHEREYVKWYGMKPELHIYMKEMYDQVLGKHPVFAVGEGTGSSFEDAHNLVDEDRSELQMAYHFEAINLSQTPNSFSLGRFKEVFTDWDRAFANKGWLAIFLANHDNARLVSRFGNTSKEFHTQSAQLLNTFLLSMRGTPYLYYGDELGMTNIDLRNIEDYEDIEAIGKYRAALKANADMEEFMTTLSYNSRENGRTPMQWDSSKNSGFTHGNPWKKVNPNYREINVQQQEKNPQSVLSHFKRMVETRKQNPVLVYGTYELIVPEHSQVYAYLRQLESIRMLVVLNFSETLAFVEIFDFHELTRENVVINNYNDVSINSGNLTLEPYQAIVFKA